MHIWTFAVWTNAIVLHSKFPQNSKGAYLDFCSLYPYVLNYERYPIGHPIQVTNDFFPFFKIHCRMQPCPLLGTAKCQGWHWKIPYFGLMKVKILPPRKLLFPVLPVKINGKLMFPLCRTCAENEDKGHCTCSSLSHGLIHTWCTMELTLAINMGYDILEIYKVLHWPSNQKINNTIGSGGLFTEYINMFLCIKTQASGYPDSVHSLQQRQQYIEEYASNEGVILGPKLIECNPGLCSIAKLTLNSFYGKFGQHSNMSNTMYITHYEKLYDFLTNQTKVITDFHVLDTGMVVMEYVHSEEFQEADYKTNVIITSMCSAYSHLKLWRIMNPLGNRVMYHDTDSVIYMSYLGQWKPPTDKYLGDLADELACHQIGCSGCSTGHWIVEFVSCGAKNYAYRLNMGEVVCKVRGFSLNFSALQVVNLNSMKEALHAWKDVDACPEMVTLKTMIMRDKLTAIVYTHKMPKHCGVMYNKRVVREDFSTIPYGY